MVLFIPETTSITEVIAYHMLLREVSPSGSLGPGRFLSLKSLYKIYPLTCGWVQWTLSYIGELGRGCLPFPACTAATMADVEELEDDSLEVVST